MNHYSMQFLDNKMSNVKQATRPEAEYFLLHIHRKICIASKNVIIIGLAILIIMCLILPLYIVTSEIYDPVLYPKNRAKKEDFSNDCISRATQYNNPYNYTVNSRVKIVHKDTEKVEGFKLVCYYSLPSEKLKQNLPWILPPDAIDPHLCTHINVAFANVFNNSIFLSEYHLSVVKKIIGLKRINRHLKVLLSIGGANKEDGFAKVVLNHANRKTFIKSINYYIKRYKFDGIDLDWEFPNQSPNTDKRQKTHFTQLLHEIRNEINRQEQHKYLLSLAVAAPQFIIDSSYDISYIDMYVDYINVMTYDFHFFTRLTPFTGINSPLYAAPNEVGYFAIMNINFSINYWHDSGMDKNKIVVGLPTYGHSYELINPNNHGINAPAKGYGKLGKSGFVDYSDVCWFIRENQIRPYFDMDSKSPYGTKNTEWVSYDDQTSLTFKAEFIKNNQFGGAMIYSLNTDDYTGICKTNGKVNRFPLTNVVKTVLSVKQL